MRTAPIIFVPTWVASTFRTHMLPMKNLIDANTLESVLSAEDLVDYALFNEFSFVRKIITTGGFEAGTLSDSSVYRELFERQLKNLSQEDNRFNITGKSNFSLTRSNLSFLDYGLIYAGLDKSLYIRKLQPIIEAKKNDISGLIGRASISSYEKMQSTIAECSSLDIDKHAGLSSMIYPSISSDDKANSKNLFAQRMFKVVNTGSFIAVYIGDDYFDYISNDNKTQKYRELYDLSTIMPATCTAMSAQRFLLLSIMQTLIDAQRSDHFVGYMDSYIYRYYIDTVRAQR